MSSPVVLITGALTGIGPATAVAFAKEGARVVVSGRREQEGKKLEKELRELGAEVEFVTTDVRHDDDIRTLIDKTVARFGRLDIAVNNAGTEGVRGLVTEQTAESYAASVLDHSIVVCGSQNVDRIRHSDCSLEFPLMFDVTVYFDGHLNSGTSRGQVIYLP